MKRRRMAVHADVGDAAARPNQLGAELECLRNPDGLDRDVRAEPVGQLHDPRDGVLGAIVRRDVGAEVARLRESSIGEVDGDDLARRVEASPS